MLGRRISSSTTGGVISTRVYPDGEDSNAVRVRAEDALIRKLEVFSMKAASITCNDR